MTKLNLKYIFLFLLLLIFGFEGFSQSEYRVYFTNKNETVYNPYEYLHPKAIERRILHGLNLYDSSDFPVNDNYLKTILGQCDSVKGISRWMNAAFIYASKQQIIKIKTYPFIRHIEAVQLGFKNSICIANTELDGDLIPNKNQKLLLTAQLDRMKGSLFKENNLDGHGVRMAILDAGFKTYNTNQAFKNIRLRDGIIATYDFIKSRTDANSGMMHGTNVFSCIGGQIGNYQIGLATGAEFLLARTESFTEFKSEEEYWLMAAEWADKNGADIINSSLGYTFQRYLPEEMDGKTCFISRAAQIAVNKGILVVSSAGNDGGTEWKKISAPGDADGVLTVGGIDPLTGIHSYFSSFGPTQDRRLKPEVCAYGTAVVAGKNGFNIAEGTSFSAPLVAGLAACLKQKYPTLKNTELKNMICRAGDLWPYYDYAHGYGVPQASIINNEANKNQATFSIKNNELDLTLYPLELKMDSISIKLIISDTNKVESDSFLYRDKISTHPPKFIKGYSLSLPSYLFYHIKNNKGYIDKYYVLNPNDEANKSITISKSISEKPFSVEFFYKGYYQEILIKE